LQTFECEINDFPRFHYRGMMIDTARWVAWLPTVLLRDAPCLTCGLPWCSHFQPLSLIKFNIDASEVTGAFNKRESVVGDVGLVSA
jgi:hypothetical protein